MDIVDSIERYLSGATVNKGVRTRMTRARDEIVRLRTAMQQILDKNGHIGERYRGCNLGRKFVLYMQNPKPKQIGVGVLSIDRGGEAQFFAGNGDAGNAIVACMDRVRIEFAAATGIRLSGFEPHGFDRAGNQKYQYQEWWLAYTKDERREGVDLARALLYDNDQLKTDINERHEL